MSDRINRINSARKKAVTYYNKTCVFCGRTPPDVTIEGSHLIKTGQVEPRLGLKGGLEVADNVKGILAMCTFCHSGFEKLTLEKRITAIFCMCETKVSERIMEFLVEISVGNEWKKYANREKSKIWEALKCQE